MLRSFKNVETELVVPWIETTRRLVQTAAATVREKPLVFTAGATCGNILSTSCAWQRRAFGRPHRLVLTSSTAALRGPQDMPIDATPYFTNRDWNRYHPRVHCHLQLWMPVLNSLCKPRLFDKMNLHRQVFKAQRSRHGTLSVREGRGRTRGYVNELSALSVMLSLRFISLLSSHLIVVSALLSRMVHFQPGALCTSSSRPRTAQHSSL